MLGVLVAAREALPVAMVRGAAQEVAGEGVDAAMLQRHLEFVQRMCVGSLVAVGQMQFSHKSFADWLVDEAGAAGEYRVAVEDGERRLAAACWGAVPRDGGGEGKEDVERGGRGAMATTTGDMVVTYALRHGVAHLVAAGRRAEARALVLENVAWLMARSADGMGVMEDCRTLVAAAAAGEDRAVDLVRRALDLSMSELRQDPRRLPGQLVGRLMGSGEGGVAPEGGRERVALRKRAGATTRTASARRCVARSARFCGGCWRTAGTGLSGGAPRRARWSRPAGRACGKSRGTRNG